MVFTGAFGSSKNLSTYQHGLLPIARFGVEQSFTKKNNAENGYLPIVLSHDKAATEMLHVRSRIGSIIAVGPTSQFFVRYGSGDFTFNSSEPGMATRIRTDGTVANLYVKVATNATTLTTSVYLRKNAANTAVAVSIPTTQTGVFTEVANKAVISDAAGTVQELNYRIQGGGGTGNVDITLLATTFAHADRYRRYDPSDTTIKSLAIVSNNGVSTTPTGGTIHYHPIISFQGIISTESNRVRFTTRIPSASGGTLRAKNLAGYISTNARTTTTTLITRDNGADGTQALSITATTTGMFEDTINTDTLAQDDTINFRVTYGASAEAIAFSHQKVELEQEVTAADVLPDVPSTAQTATMQNHSLINMDRDGIAITEGTTNYISVAGSTTTTAPFTTAAAADVLTLKPLKTIYSTGIYILANSLNQTASTLQVYKNGSNIDSNLDVSVAASGTGYFTNTTVSVVDAASTTSSSDTLVYRFIPGTSLSGTAAITVNHLSVISGSQAPPPPAAGGALVKLAPEDVAITEAINLIRGRIQQLSESINITEAVARILGKTLTVNESINITEAINRIKNISRVVGETVALTEASNYIKAMSKVVNESVNITEAANRAIALTRTANESVNITEAVNRLLAKSLTVNETINITEAISKILGQSKTISETVNITESVIKVAGLARVVNETVNITEATNFIRALSRIVNESVNITETINRVSALVRTIPESVNISEGIINALGLSRTTNESIAITEAVNKVIITAQALVKTVDEQLDITEAIDRIAGLSRVIDESIAITEAVNYARALARIVNESADITETVNRVVALTRQVNETINLAEALVRVPGIVKVVGGVPLTLPGDFVGGDFVTGDFVAGGTYMEEVIGITEAVNKLIAQPPANVQTADELIGITEVINYLMAKVRVVDEAIVISESINRLSNMVRQVNESITIGEAHNIARNLTRIQNEQIQVTEILNRLTGLSRVVDESVGILEDAQRNLSLTRIANETINLTEALNTALAKIRIINESVDINELVNAVTAVGGEALTKVVNESLNISEALNVIFGRVKVVSETINISEAAPIRLRGLSRAVNESVELTESINRIGAFVRTVNESVHITELTQKVQALVRAISETENITEAVQYVRGLSKIVNETIALTESQISAKGKALIIAEVVAIAENIISLIEFQAFIPQEELSLGMALGSNAVHRRRKYSRFPTFRKLQYKPVRLYQQTSPMQIEDYRKRKEPEAKPKIDKEHLDIKREVTAKLTVRYNIGNVLSAEQLAAKALVSQLRTSRYPHEIEDSHSQYQHDKVLPSVPSVLRARTIPPQTKQIETKRNDVILIKDVVSAKLETVYKHAQEVTSAPLTIKYNTLEETSRRSGRLLYNRYTTVTSSPLTCGYDIADSKEYQELVEMRDFLEVATANTELLLMGRGEEEDDDDDWEEEE